MMYTTVLHGGVCHHTSTPHKSGIKMKEKKKNGGDLRVDGGREAIVHATIKPSSRQFVCST